MVAKATGLPEASVPRWMAALAGLHDIGKAIPGFQAKWPPGQREDEVAGLSFHPALALRCDQHSRATAALLAPMLERVAGAERLWCQHVVQSVSAHHGYHFSTTQAAQGAPLREPAVWQQARDVLLEAYWAALSPAGVPTAIEGDLPLINWLAGLTSASDWIASNPLWFPPGERSDELRAHFRLSQDLAMRALKEIGWQGWRPLLCEAVGVEQLLPRMIGRSGVPPRPLQQAGDDLLRATRGPALMLVEAPMGEGKTELAFLAHLRLQTANQHRGFFIALPTQATGNALFRRARTFLEAFASGPLDLQLVHGGAAMNEDLAALRDVGDSAADTLSASAWFGQRRRPLLSPYGVGTIDQALYAVLNVKHHFVRLWGLSNRVVVLDEVHAYDSYTGGLIEMLLRWLRALGCSVVLMSATLPRARRQSLLAAWGVNDPLPDLPYPRIGLVDDAGFRGTHVDARPLAPVGLSGLGSDVDALADMAIMQVSQGGCGALIVNTVARAQALYLALHARLRGQGLGPDIPLVLFHARFPADERQRLESRVMSMFGPQGDRPVRALLVATQVVEQSLALDFDFMLSDLAPVDLLLQRAGRLHRHQRVSRPSAHLSARLGVAGLEADRPPELKLTAWEFVYHPYILLRTWAFLRHKQVLELPGDIDRLVQVVYDRSCELPEDVDTQVRSLIEIEAYGEYLADVKALEQLAANIAVDPTAEVHRAYDGKPRGREEDEQAPGLVNTTRQGEASVTLVPVVVGESGRWHVQEGDAGFNPEAVVDASTAKALYNRQLRVSRRRVVRHFETQRLPRAFADHPLLCQMKPLCLVGNRAADAALGLSLSPELGLIFDDATKADVSEGAS